MRHVAALIALALVGCESPVQFTDDLDFTLDFVPFVADFDDDALHTPYVQGAQVTVFAHPRGGIDPTNLSFESDDPDVFEVVQVQQDPETGDLVLEGVAMGQGETDLVVTRRGDTLDTAPIEVAFPTRAELHAAGPLFVDLDEPESTPKVLAGGLATFQVQYFAGDERLYGNGVLGALNFQGIQTAQVEQSYLFESREWLQVSGVDPGLASVDVEVDGRLLDTAPFEIVDPSAIARMQIHGTDERGDTNEDWEVLVAQAEDADGAPIYGVDFAWELDGVPQQGVGDLYRYQFQRGAGRQVRASFGDQDARVTANIGEGYVDSSNNVGCDAGAGAGLGGVAWLVGLVATRRRATSSSARG